MGKENKIKKERYTKKQYNIRMYKRLDSTHTSCDVCGWNIDPRLLSDRKSGLDVHHINPVALGGTDDSDNLIVLCPNCHATIHALWLIDSTIGYYGGPKNREDLISVLTEIRDSPDTYYESIQLTDEDLFQDIQ